MAGITWATRTDSSLCFRCKNLNRWAAAHHSSSPRTPLEHTGITGNTGIPGQLWSLSYNAYSLTAVISSLTVQLEHGRDSVKRCWLKRQLWIHVWHLHRSVRLFLRQGCWAVQTWARAGEDELWTCSGVFMGPGGDFHVVENTTAFDGFLGLPHFSFNRCPCLYGPTEQ